MSILAPAVPGQAGLLASSLILLNPPAAGGQQSDRLGGKEAESGFGECPTCQRLGTFRDTEYGSSTAGPQLAGDR